jgi:putative lipoprotein
MPASPPASPPSPATSAVPADTEPPHETSAAESSLSIKRGVVMLAQDRATFRPCDENVELWLVDQTDGLLKEQFASRSGSEPPMIYVEVYGERAPVTEDVAAARAYAGTLILEDVLYAGLQSEVRGCAAAPPTYIVAARGNEPAWSVEVTEDQVKWQQAAAPKQITLKAPQTEDAEGAVRYRANGEGHELELLIAEQHCKDSMSGEFFAYSAKATLDGKELLGCARIGRE